MAPPPEHTLHCVRALAARPVSNDTVTLRNSRYDGEMSLIHRRMHSAHPRRGLHAFAFVCAVLQLMLITSGQMQRTPSPTSPLSEAIAIAAIDRPPYSRTLLTDNANEECSSRRNGRMGLDAERSRLP